MFTESECEDCRDRSRTGVQCTGADTSFYGGFGRSACVAEFDNIVPGEAAYEHEGPVYLRLGTNREPEIYKEDYVFRIGKAVTLREGKDITLIGTGSMLKDVLDIAEKLGNDGICARVINIHTIKPIDKAVVIKAAEETGKIITVEDHNIVGGLGSAVAEVIAESGVGVTFKRYGLKDFSKGYGTYTQVKEMNAIGIEKICRELYGT